jgi:hypothetical protein
VRLVVGVINLVEKVRELAQRGVVVTDGRRAGQLAFGMALRQAEELRRPDASAPGYAVGYGGAAPEIVKEGISEYFIYTVGGRQTVPQGWSQRMLSFSAREVEFDVLYRVRPYQYGERPVRFYMLVNDQEHKLGTTPLPDGTVRTFRRSERDGLSFLGRQRITYVPIKEDIELQLGTDDEVVREGMVMRVERSDFIFDHQPPRVVGWDQTSYAREQLRNYRARPIRVEVRRRIPGDVELEAEGAKLHDYHTVEWTVEVPPRETRQLDYRYTEHSGRNARQNRIQLTQ